MLTDKEKLDGNDAISQNTDEIIDINIEGVKRQKFRINGNPKAILELDTNDLNIVQRLREVYPKLNKLAGEATAKVDIDSSTTVEEQLENLADVLKEIDNNMRNYLDYIFNSNVSEVCSPYKSLYSPQGGKFVFEHITETLGKLYSANITSEAQKMSKRFREHTDKYTGKRR